MKLHMLNNVKERRKENETCDDPLIRKERKLGTERIVQACYKKEVERERAHCRK